VHIVSIFEKFLVNKHSLNEKSLKKLDLRTIFQETMLRIKKDVNLKNKSTLDLNKITLSIVKNVIKEKIINSDKQVTMGTNSKSALQRDMDVNTIPTAPITSNYRPMLSKDYIKGEQYDVFTQYENVLKNRTTDINTTKNTSTLAQASLKESSSKDENETDTAMTNEEFMKKLNHMNSLRNTGETLQNTGETLQNTGETLQNTGETLQKILPPTDVLPTIQKIDENIKTPTKTSITLDQLDQLKQRIKNKTNKSSQSFEEFLSIPHKKVYNDPNNAETSPETRPVQKDKKDGKIKESVLRYLLIDSYDRNIKNYENKYDYVIHFETPIEHIVSVKLVQAIYSEINDGTIAAKHKAYYVNLMIEEFEEISSNYCNNYTTCRAFTQLPIQNIDNTYDTNSPTKKFKTPIKSLKKISIRILNRDGSPYTNSIIGEHFFKFELKLNEPEKHSNTITSLNIDDMYDETSSESTSNSSIYNEEQTAGVNHETKVDPETKLDPVVDPETVEETKVDPVADPETLAKQLIETFVETIIDKVIDENIKS
jgi:hypothetical protein